jgi:hypothetical protein
MQLLKLRIQKTADWRANDEMSQKNRRKRNKLKIVENIMSAPNR